MTESDKILHKVLVESGQDPSSKSISAYIIEHYPFHPGPIQGTLTYNGYVIYRSEERHLNMNGLEETLAKLGIEASTILFLSKHRSTVRNSWVCFDSMCPTLMPLETAYSVIFGE